MKHGAPTSSYMPGLGGWEQTASSTQLRCTGDRPSGMVLYRYSCSLSLHCPPGLRLQTAKIGFQNVSTCEREARVKSDQNSTLLASPNAPRGGLSIVFPSSQFDWHAYLARAE
eukprot:scaffold14974_cov195-Amphora_coffeaeformis.AAC.61